MHTPKQSAFVGEYLIDLNATQAAIRAGYSVKTAKEQATRLLSNVHVAAAIASAKFERSRRTNITADRVLQELARVAFFDIAKAFNPDGGLLPSRPDGRGHAQSALVGIELSEIRDGDGVVVGTLKKVKIADKLVALDQLARHLGLLNDKLTLKGDAENPLLVLLQRVQGTVLPVPHERVDEDEGYRRAA